MKLPDTATSQNMMYHAPISNWLISNSLPWLMGQDGTLEVSVGH